jgi:hypothetical protein
MSMLLLDVFDRRRGRDTLARRGSRADTHYHIVTTFEAKESGASGVLAQSLGISERLEWLLEVCFSSQSTGGTKQSTGQRRPVQ